MILSDAIHLLRRTGFGVTAQEAKALAKKTLSSAVGYVLDVRRNPAPVRPPELDDPAVAGWNERVACIHYWFDRMATMPAPIQEKMTLFWHGHFCSETDKVQSNAFMWDQNALYRTQGMGSFVTLTKAMAVQPAMLIYLDNWMNRAGTPQENFARELMELFTMGVGNYTQDDVVAAARAWTGHGLTNDATAYQFRADRHDAGLKTFLGKTANFDGPDIIDEILVNNSTSRMAAARFIVSKLWSFFAYPDPSPAVVDDLVAKLQSSGTITAMLRQIFLHPEFYSAKAKKALLRSPVEYLAAAMKHTGLPASTVHPEWWMPLMGQEIFNPPNVDGWKQNVLSCGGYYGRTAFAKYIRTPAKQSGVLSGLESQTVDTAVTTTLTAFGILEPTSQTRSVFKSLIEQERAAGGAAQRQNLIQLALLSPDFNVS